ncbi:MAG: hypothetical protein H6835_16080 [Planctomycetes bacterium]|nr:hypothetical protein [Planctomycetota bacterium]
MVAHSRSVPAPVAALRRVAWCLTAAALALSPTAAPAQGGTWTQVSSPAPGSVGLMLLLPDGTVMCNNSGTSTAWYRLTPSATGSYVNGTWSTLAPMHDSRLYFQSQVLRDGRVFVSGAEYGTGKSTAEIYDPQTNTWTVLTPPAALWNPVSDQFYDCNSEILPDGRVLLMPVFPHSPGIGLIYAPATDTWSQAGHLAHGTWQDEATWVKLADDSILTVDPFGTQSERYRPATNTWVADSNVPTALYDPYLHEIGPGVLLPDGRAFFIGSTGHTALYTPSPSQPPGAGTWTAGPDLPNGTGAPDAPCAMLVNGRVLCAVSPAPTATSGFPSPTTFCEYDPVTDSFATVSAPSGSSWNQPSFCSLFLSLPDGTVLHSHFGNDLHVYSPNGAPLTAGRPAITSITQNGDGSFHLVGTGLNGMSEGASYGDDWQMNSNYPIVLLTSGSAVYRARTYDWSGTSVQTGAQVLSTEFRLPSMPAGTYSLIVSASGLQSTPVSITVTSSSWSSLDNGLAGTNGVPTMLGSGALVADTTTTFLMVQCLGSTVGVSALGTTAIYQPLFGGVLVPDPVVLAPFVTATSGFASLPVYWQPNLPAGVPVYAQSWILDGAGPQGFAATNAVWATVQ